MAPSAGKRRTATGRTLGSGLGRRPRQRPEESGSAKRRRPRDSVFIPLLTVWVVVLFLLLMLVFWAKGNPFRSFSARPKVTDTAAVSEPRQAGRTPQERAPAPAASPARPMSAVQKNSAQGGSESKQNPVVASVPKAPPVSPTPPGVPEKPPVGRIALVIDDFGYDVKIARKFINLPFPMTLAVLPHLPHTREVAALAAAHGHEVLLHMPMEPHGYPNNDPGRGALLVAMAPDEMVSRIDKALKEIPSARGVNNHMGSKFTEDPEAMRVVLGHLKARGLYYLDSYTSAHSNALSVARELGLSCIQRDIFLDHEPTEAFIRRQLEELIRLAKLEGRAVAIGHPYPVTLKVLEEKVLDFEKDGIQVVPLKTLLQEAPKENEVKAGA